MHALLERTKNRLSSGGLIRHAVQLFTNVALENFKCALIKFQSKTSSNALRNPLLKSQFLTAERRKLVY